MGQFAKLRGYPAVDDHTVTAPNADTLYTVVWLDVSKEPWIVSAPDMKGRFFLLPMLDGWTTVFADPGKRTTGTAAQKFAITGPGWSGTLPAGSQGIQVGNRHGVAARPDLLHRYARGLQGGACAAGPDDGRAAVVLWQAVHAGAGDRRSEHRHEDLDPRSGQRHGRGVLLQAVRATAEDQSARRPRMRRWWRSSPRSASCRGRTSMRRSSTRRSRRDSPAFPKPAQEKIMAWMKEGVVAGDMKLTDGWAFTTKTGLYGTALPPAGADHGDRPRREPPAGRGLPHVRGAGRPQDVRAARTSTSCTSTRANCRRSTASGR